MPRPVPKRAGKSRQRLNALNAEDRVAGPATLALLVSFWLPWYSLGPFSADGLSVHGWLFVAVLNSNVLLLYCPITAFGVGDLAEQGRMSKDQLLILMTGFNVALVALGFLLKPAGFSWSWGRATFSRRPPPSWLFCRSAFPSSRLGAGAESVAPIAGPRSCGVCSVLADGLVYRHIHAGCPDAESMATIQVVVGQAHFQQKVLTLPPGAPARRRY